MPETLNIQIKDKTGNLINPKTLAALVATADGKTVEQRLAEVYALASGATVTKVVADIAARDALAGMRTGWQVWVVDAAADPTVTAGGAKYLYDADAGEPVDGVAPGAWIKTAESESMDVVLQWAAMEGIPEVLKKLGLDGLNYTRNTVLRQKPSRKAISSPVSRFLRHAKTQPRAHSVSLLRQCSGRELLSASASEPPCRNRLIYFLAVRKLTPKPAATAAAGAACIRRIISSRPLAVSLAFLWLFTLSSVRFVVVCELQLYRFEAG